jgi:hypothetical protein
VSSAVHVLTSRPLPLPSKAALTVEDHLYCLRTVLSRELHNRQTSGTFPAAEEVRHALDSLAALAALLRREESASGCNPAVAGPPGSC